MSIVTAVSSRAPVELRVVSDAAQLERLRPAWAELLERSACNEPMLSPTWLLGWWRVFGSLGGRRLQAALFYEGERLIGLAPLLKRRHWYRPGIPFQRLEPLGTGEHERDRVWSDYVTVIAEHGAEERVAARLARVLATGALGNWDELVFPSLDGANPSSSMLWEAFRREGLGATYAVIDAAPYVRLPRTWDAYLKSLSSSKRYFLTRTLRDFDAWARGEATVNCVESVAGLEEGLGILVSLHNDRWHGHGPARAFRSPRFTAFHKAILPELLEQGRLELLWLCVRGEPVAALYNLVWNGKVYFYQSGRKRDVPAGLRPGVVMHAQAIRRAIAAGRREYDFLAEPAQYKMKLATATRPLVQLRVVRRPGSLRELAHRLAEGGMNHVRRLRHRCFTSRWFGPTRLTDTNHLPIAKVW
jgi:CelD/BcsL family acetyltransferase involved in cellulose biosynthesis